MTVLLQTGRLKVKTKKVDVLRVEFQRPPANTK